MREWIAGKLIKLAFWIINDKEVVRDTIYLLNKAVLKGML